MKIKYYLKALLTGRIGHMKIASEKFISGGDVNRLQADDPEKQILSLLRWVNRNRTLMDLISLDRQHVFRAVILEKEVRVNCYLGLDGGDNRHLLEDPFDSDCIYGFYQKKWDDAIGASYAPFMTPVKDDKEEIYFDPKPLFSYAYRLTDEQRHSLVDGNST